MRVMILIIFGLKRHCFHCCSNLIEPEKVCRKRSGDLGRRKEESTETNTKTEKE